MYAGKVAEEGSVDEIFTRPHHPYTWGLLGSLPRLDADVERLTQIPGQPPSMLRPPSGCRFHPRCAYVMEICKTKDPELLPTQRDANHLQACHLDEDETKDRPSARARGDRPARLATTPAPPTMATASCSSSRT